MSSSQHAGSQRMSPEVPTACSPPKSTAPETAARSTCSPLLQSKTPASAPTGEGLAAAASARHCNQPSIWCETHQPQTRTVSHASTHIIHTHPPLPSCQQAKQSQQVISYTSACVCCNSTAQAQNVRSR